MTLDTRGVSMRSYLPGEYVVAEYKTGRYIGKVVQDKGSKIVVEVLAVATHPFQGDLHRPFQVEGAFFQTRKALAHHEKANMHKSSVSPYTEQDIPDYLDSLRLALNEAKQEMEARGDEWGKAALLHLTSLEQEYFSRT